MEIDLKTRIIPAIDLIDGKCVRLFQGSYEKSKVYANDPVEVAKKWRDLGFANLHIVDLDGAKKGSLVNWEVISQIVKNCGEQMLIQVGGGIREISTLDKLFEIGINRAIIGTVALEHGDLLTSMLKKFKKKIIVSLDAKNGKLMSKGWLKGTDNDLFETAKSLEARGVGRVIFTDVLKDGTNTEPNFTSIQNLVNALSIPVISAGGVSSASQVERLVEIGVEQVIIGRALYENQDLISQVQKEAVKC